MPKMSSTIKGVGFLVLAALIISLQNVVIKWIGGDYSALEIVVFRSLIALPFTLFFYRAEGKRGLPTTQQPKLEYIRGIFLFLSYTTAMMGLAALPLADIEAIRFSGPLMITFFVCCDVGRKGGATPLAGTNCWFCRGSFDRQARFRNLQPGFHFHFDIRTFLCVDGYTHS
jgi:drug/metabolite transporter (DMT)-like permease